MKFDVQIEALKAFVSASGNGRQPVGSDAIAARMPVSAATAGLNNSFFTDSGLIIRQSKGKYVPSDVVCEFARRHGFDPRGAGLLLAEPLSKTWYWQAVHQQASFGSVPRTMMIEVLAQVAGATKEHWGHLSAILDWLEYAGLIVVKGDMISLSANAVVPEPEPEAIVTPPAASEVSKPTTPRVDETPDRSDLVLTFSLEFSLTADELTMFSPAQIEQLFTSIGQIQAIRNTIQR